MGLFDRKKSQAQFQVISPFNQLPKFLKGTGKEIGTGAFDTFLDLIQRGETPASQELFSRSRTRSIKDFQDATGQAGLELNRAGLASSGTRDKIFPSLALSLADVLTQQDARRAERQRNTQIQGSQLGLNAINANSQNTVLNPIVRQEGLGSQLLNQGIGALAGGAFSSLGSFGANATSQGLSGLFGGFGSGG